MPPADGKFSSLPNPQCPIKISDGEKTGEKKKRREHSEKSLGCQNIHQQNETQCGHLTLSTFVLYCQNKAEMFQLRIWTINQRASLGKLLLSMEKSYLDTYRDETHLHPSKAFIKAFLCTCAIFFPTSQYLTAGGKEKKK